ncbi:MAG: DoxX-like family protein [Maribacter sp.]
MTKQLLNKVLTAVIALVWFINGLICKILNYVPRHQEIVAEILDAEYAVIFTKAIGISEIAMAIWIFSGIKSRLNAVIQIIIIAVMNILEFMLVPELLLWGRFNILFATLLIIVIYYNEFVLKRSLST